MALSWKNRLREVVATVAVLAFTAVVYGPVRGLGLVWDDRPLLHAEMTFAGIRHAPPPATVAAILGILAR